MNTARVDLSERTNDVATQPTAETGDAQDAPSADTPDFPPTNQSEETNPVVARADRRGTETEAEGSVQEGRRRRRRVNIGWFGEYDIDSKHLKDPRFAANEAEDIYIFLRELEKTKLRGDGEPIIPALEVPNYPLKRMRFINWLFAMHRKNREDERHGIKMPSNTVHLAMHYVDRFIESYDGEPKDMLTARCLSILVQWRSKVWVQVMVTALHLASKYEDYYPVEVPTIKKNMMEAESRKVTEHAVLAMESEFFQILGDFMAPTSTAFVHRYLQAVGMELNLAAVHTARYLCTLGLCDYSLTGEYYSKIAAGAAFVAYNKYSPAASKGLDTVEFPKAMEVHCGYTLDEIKPVVTELLERAEMMERDAMPRENDGVESNRDKNGVIEANIGAEDADVVHPSAVYEYYKTAGVVSTNTFPDFAGFFENCPREDRLESPEANRNEI